MRPTTCSIVRTYFMRSGFLANGVQACIGVKRGASVPYSFPPEKRRGDPVSSFCDRPSLNPCPPSSLQSRDMHCDKPANGFTDCSKRIFWPPPPYPSTHSSPVLPCVPESDKAAKVGGVGEGEENLLKSTLGKGPSPTRMNGKTHRPSSSSYHHHNGGAFRPR